MLDRLWTGGVCGFRHINENIYAERFNPVDGAGAALACSRSPLQTYASIRYLGLWMCLLRGPIFIYSPALANDPATL